MAILLVVWLVSVPCVFAKVTVAFETTAPTALHPGFSGFNAAFGVGTAIEYDDPNFQELAATFSAGWLRYPAGTRSDAFDWTTGVLLQSWIDSMTTHSNASVAAKLQDDLPIVVGKGGAQFADFANLASNLDARIVVCVNAFTDSPQSAGALAKYALKNQIKVAVWELANEPYLFVGAGNFFSSATDYANKMKPYRDAIKAADSNAVVALFFAPPRDPNWGIELGRYPHQYWDAVTYHHYPDIGNATNFSELMAIDNDVLVNDTTKYVTSYLEQHTRPGTPFLITEYDPTLNGPPNGTLYGGIYTAEYALRMSTIPRMHFVGMHELQNGNGIDLTNAHKQAVLAAYDAGTTTNTAGLPFGFYATAQALGVSVANGALANSDAVYPTTVRGGATVPTSHSGRIPAVYAQAYHGGDWRYVVLTNKGASNEVAEITADGVALTNQMAMTFVTGTDPSLVNTNPPPNNLQLQTQTVANPVTIPAYSVVRLEWKVIPVPVATPTITPEGGTFADYVWVKMACATALAKIRYTVDGSEPTPTSALYAQPFKVTQSEIVTAKAFKLADAGSGAVLENYTITRPAITTASVLPVGNVGAEYKITLQAADGKAPYAWSLASGSKLPAGLRLSSNGTLSGKPATTGTFNFTVKVRDAKLGTDTQSFTVTIN